MKLPAQSVELLSEPLAPETFGRFALSGLNSGCGGRMQAGCLNSDIVRFIGSDGAATEPGRLALVDGHYYVQHDATEVHPIPDETFEWAFSEHFIEHVAPSEAIAWLADVRRLLKPGGLVRVSTPDLRRYVEGYLDPDKRFFDEHRHRIEPVIEGILKAGAERKRPATLRREYFEDDTRVPARPAFMFNQIFLLPLWHHRWIYDLEELRHAAVSAGFEPDAVNERSFGDSAHAQLGELDAPMHNDESIYVEITKT